MQKQHSKRYLTAKKTIASGKIYELAEAITQLKQLPLPKFDPTVTLSMHTTADPKKSDQMIRGTSKLPHGSGKEIRVLVFAQGQAAEAAKEAGALYVGFEDLIKKCQEGFQDFDVAIATPSAMAEVRKLGRVLGPRGLMPNPKTGTVTEDTAAAVVECKAGRVEFKLDRNGNLSVPVGKLSFELDFLQNNAQAVIQSIVRAKPPSVKGSYLASLSISASMLPSLPLDPNAYLKN